MRRRITKPNLTTDDIGNKDIFVFGSNESGLHGGGAAAFAANELDAKYGCGFGHTGSTFAIPTKDWFIDTLPLYVIEFYIKRFLQYVEECPNLKFRVTQIGCGLAGYQPKHIAPLFWPAVSMKNVWLPQEFWDILFPKTKIKQNYEQERISKTV